ncbi:MAG TPA: HAMP domain-containing sensor histidine kinase [Gemmatimonadaceae bacterium]|nr:HAMP domain-containing sensor histidine kinase [Gemmatimonadaceae bacterium]
MSTGLAAAAEHEGVQPRWQTWLPLGFVMTVLILLGALPLAFARYTQPLHTAVRQLGEPGRTFVTRIQLSLALEGALVHDYVEGPDDLLVSRYRVAVSEEQEAHRRLAPLAERMDGAVQLRYSELQQLQQRWHAAVDDYLAGGTDTDSPRDPVSQDLYQSMVLAAALLDDEIARFTHGTRARILAAERVERHVTLALLLMAVAAVIVVARLGHKLRSYADTADRRRADLERAIEGRARLLRGVSHDLKNPLNAIDGHAQLLETGIKGTMSDDQRDSVLRIRRSVQGVLTLVNDLLDLSSADAGQLRIVVRQCEPGVVVRDAVEEHQPAAGMAGHSLEVVERTVIQRVESDADRIRQILGNLLSNAIKYTPRGGEIRVILDVVTRSGHNWGTISVADSGTGIPADMHEAVFAEFTRLDAHRHEPGAGLGLSIARQLARLLGGDLTLESEPGRGSTFTLLLPLEQQERT